MAFVASADALASNDFAYEITGLKADNYFVSATGDDDGNSVFDSQIETFGAYPSTAAQEAVFVATNASKVEAIDFSVSSSFIIGVVGGVGSPCDEDGDCTFLQDAECITSFENGYCSRLCDDGGCGPYGSCEELECSGEPCQVCLLECLNDTTCRTDEGYGCDPCGTCSPDGFCGPPGQ